MKSNHGAAKFQHTRPIQNMATFTRLDCEDRFELLIFLSSLGCASYMPADDAVYEDAKSLFEFLNTENNGISTRRRRENGNDSDSEDDIEITNAIQDSLEEIVKDLCTDIDCLENLNPALEFPAQDYSHHEASSSIRQGISSSATGVSNATSPRNEHKVDTTGKELPTKCKVDKELKQDTLGETLGELIDTKIKDLERAYNSVAGLMERVGFSRDLVEDALEERLRRSEGAANVNEKNEREVDAFIQLRRKGHKDVKPQRPTYPKIHKDHLSVDTLRYYNLPYEDDLEDPNYFVILREMDRYEIEVFFEHTRRIRSSPHPTFVEKRPGKPYA